MIETACANAHDRQGRRDPAKYRAGLGNQVDARYNVRCENHEPEDAVKGRTLIIAVWWLALLLLLAMLVLPGLGVVLGPVAFWLMLIIGFFILLELTRRPPAGTGPDAVAQADELAFSDPAFEAAVREVLAITGKHAHHGTLEFDGRLMCEPGDAYARLNARLAGMDRRIVLQDAGAGRTQVLLLPAEAVPAAPVRSRPWLNVLLFVFTLITTTLAGAAIEGVDVLQDPGQFSRGLPYSLALLLILGAHELGHYFAARHHRMNVSLPYFIPVPFGLGTFGAFIRMRSLAPDRKALFDMAVAGPLTGLVFAVAAMLVGLRLSHVVPGAAPSGIEGIFGSSLDVGSSLLLTLLAKLSMGNALSAGYTIHLNPLAYAGWLGLLVTALNLLPIGQLDGGHIAHAVFGPAGAHRVSILAAGALLLLSLFVWPGLLLFAVLVLFFAGTHDAPSADDATPLTYGRKWLGYANFAILLIILLPVPHNLFPHLGINCPYL